MKKILTACSCAALALTSFPSYSMDVKPFFGINLAANGVSYSDDLNDYADDLDIELPTGFLGAGAEAGIKFATQNVWNGGITLAYDYVFDSEADTDDNPYIYSMNIGFSAISATFDNYIRVSGNTLQRQDIVLGLGVARATERVKIIALNDVKEEDDATTLVLKVGYNHQFSDNVEWYLNGRWFIPSSDSEVKALFNANIGLRFTF